MTSEAAADASRSHGDDAPPRSAEEIVPNLEAEEEETKRMSMLDVAFGKRREKVVLQRLLVVARLPGGDNDDDDAPAIDRTPVAAHHEKLIFRLSKENVRDNITGLLLVYPSCLLHVVESTREILISILRDVTALQQQDEGENSTLLDAKVVFMVNNPRNRLFQQWSYKVLDADQAEGGTLPKRHDEEEDNTESTVCGILLVLQKLSAELEISEKPLPGSALDGNRDLVVPQRVLEELLEAAELQSVSQYLQMYATPLHIIIQFGQ
ncbi:unnamed protein product [Ophioblennius macclurei]